jgi:hypothetical protein
MTTIYIYSICVLRFKEMNEHQLSLSDHPPFFLDHKYLFLLYKVLCHCRATYWNTILKDVTILLLLLLSSITNFLFITCVAVIENHFVCIKTMTMMP